jgi:hypothetical protein
MFRRVSKIFTIFSVAAALLIPGWAADPASPAAPSTPTAASPSDIAKLKVQLDEQQKVIEQLRFALEEQRKMLEKAGFAAAKAQPVAEKPLIASTTPMAAPSTDTPPPAPKFDPPTPQSLREGQDYPLQLKLGTVSIMPVGFMDLTAVWRDKDAGSSIGTSFGSVPYGNTTAGKLSEFRFSPQNSRLGFRVDADVKGAHVIGYNEFDFLGTSGTNNLGVTNGAFVPRIRLYWVDVRKDKYEVLAGQSWSLLTPNRKGLSALPSDLFYSQVMDVNYVVGLTWTRQPGVRFIYHPTNKVAMGVSFENPNQYMGGSSGGGAVILPSALTALAGSQLDNASNVLATPNVHPDIIAKIAFDPNAHLHFEVAGIERTFKVWDPSTNAYSTKAGGGGSINANVEVFKGFRLITNNFWSDGGGRYLFGQAPDVVVRANGTLSPIHAGGFVEGFEAQVNPNLMLWGYYGAVLVGRDVALDANGTSLIGYGFTGSANSQNRAIQEGTIGFTKTFWKDAKYGSLSFIGQYEYATRNPWYVATNAPKSAHDNTIYMDLRYTLPGGVPTSREK